MFFNKIDICSTQNKENHRKNKKKQENTRKARKNDDT